MDHRRLLLDRRRPGAGERALGEVRAAARVSTRDSRGAPDRGGAPLPAGAAYGPPVPRTANAAGPDPRRK
jgi:hypothetical protein